MTQKLVLLAGLSVILITTFIAVCDANDPCLKQGIAFVANQPLGAVGFGHVAVGFLRCDGNFFFASLGPGNYAFPATVKADIETESFADWVHAESWLWNANYHKIKVIQIDNPDPNAAMDEINKPENYNLLASTAWDQETEDNCLTFTIKVLTAYGVNGLSTSPPTEAPNMYFEAYIPGKEYSWSNDLNRYSDSEGNTLSSDQAIQNAAVAGASNMGTQLVSQENAAKKALQTFYSDFAGVSIAFSPDGSKLATGGSDYTVRVWDVANGNELQTQVVGGGVYAISSDGSKLATSSNDTIRIWDVATGKELQTLVIGSSAISGAFSSDGSKLATSSIDSIARIWDVATGKELQTLKKLDSFVRSVAFSPDGTRLATGSYDETARIWDIATGKELQKLVDKDGVYSVAFSPDGSKLATSSDNATIWDVTTGKKLQELIIGTRVFSVVFSPDGSKLATETLSSAQVWGLVTTVSTANNQVLKTYPQQQNSKVEKVVTNKTPGFSGILAFVALLYIFISWRKN